MTVAQVHGWRWFGGLLTDPEGRRQRGWWGEREGGGEERGERQTDRQTDRQRTETERNRQTETERRRVTMTITQVHRSGCRRWGPTRN